MNITISRLSLAGAATLACALAGCGGGNTNAPLPVVGIQQYVQIERLARPAVKELFEKFVDHQTSNAAEPYADSTLQTQIVAFTNALRPPKASVGSNYGTAIASVLYPDEITVDLSQTGRAAYLGKETGGVTGGGSTFGGRDLSDDVIGISLGVVFGKTLGPAATGGLGLQPEDNEENNCLSTENLPTPRTSQTKVATFPYLATPH